MAGGVILLGNRLPLVPVGAETWRLAGGGGDDRFEVGAETGSAARAGGG